jgi:hypothetical protein
LGGLENLSVAYDKLTQDVQTMKSSIFYALGFLKGERQVCQHKQKLENLFQPVIRLGDGTRNAISKMETLVHVRPAVVRLK